MIPVRVCRYCCEWPCRCRLAPRVERCACRGLIVAEPRDVVAAVQAHNATPEHESWRTRREGT